MADHSLKRKLVALLKEWVDETDVLSDAQVALNQLWVSIDQDDYDGSEARLKTLEEYLERIAENIRPKRRTEAKRAFRECLDEIKDVVSAITTQ